MLNSKIEVREYFGYAAERNVSYRVLAIFDVNGTFMAIKNFEPRKCDGSCNDKHEVFKSHEHEIVMVFK